MRVRAMRIHETGGPEVFRSEEVELPAPGEGEVVVRHRAIGLNFIEVYQRKGLYPLPMPAILGSEGAGIVEALGPMVEGLRVGDRVAYGNAPPGAYCDARIVPARVLVKVPDTIDDARAAAIMLKGMTAEYLLRRAYPVKPGDTIVFHAAAGGVGSIATQWAKHLGATVIGTVGSEAKVDVARANGCDHVEVLREGWSARVRELTGGRGVQVVYDSIGKDTLLQSFDCLAPRGMVALFGQSSGNAPPIDIGVIAKASYYLTRPSLFAYNGTRPELDASAAALFDVMARGAVVIPAPRQVRLAEVADAHRALEGRQTTGATVLVP